MNDSFMCELYYEKGQGVKRELISLILKNCDLGFTPNLMSIYISMDEIHEDMVYDEAFLKLVLSKEEDAAVKILPGNVGYSNLKR